MPQLIEQWRMKSADGIAIGFISIWFLGDVFNLAGSLWARLLPEVISIAVWFCIADFMMIFSYFYYTRIYPQHHKTKPVASAETTESQSPQAPLLRRRSSALTDIALEPEEYSVFTKYILPVLFVIGAGCFGYLFAGSDSSANDGQDADILLGPQIVGYLSAFLYLGARIPQIIQNHKRRSVEGLSLLFFMFSTLGNLTYAGQILFYRSDSTYLLLNLSWLLGSLGTIFEDCIIFLQFYMYKGHHEALHIA
ncbi:hypothetical protein METBIDRAFT_32008 [Metschnikowia bicuspidata var. bicuspidata NRRL YB-4993]|uniref:PQ-loop-domain-containing protein n=1 Tax=Metschnikowia bicuspidata var. bicuspidata NRRL YB-4993 TaxID=869754 RepID=A0A1A0HBV3_9ASCO|nr:hypothetical protein METBIDRAFT_32008 [Metschnikowia bicuspidata var. bicuspidata NRRL YB-4993]OBA21491.1 hypothetical protein METBIDRAFT_32008 [Metschnikowia bicuspidata var. bicuspidata NRRL YB-4993]